MLKKIVATVLAASALVIGGATASSATPNDRFCEPGEFCLYEGMNYGSAMRTFSWDSSNYAQNNFFWPIAQQSLSINDRASSTRNLNDAFAYRTYEHPNYAGDYRHHRPANSGCVSLVCSEYPLPGLWSQNSYSSGRWIGI
ncbi:peptidase inhibitor family I36 protein [Streptomyces sp. NPDC056534]|uniref:peptidase inhibitor family I36 protein n=1 Tax=Streptomyces sp. NPDC056534 TaxID=3345857 RepID=UPI00369F22F1